MRYSDTKLIITFCNDVAKLGHIHVPRFAETKPIVTQGRVAEMLQQAMKNLRGGHNRGLKSMQRADTPTNSPGLPKNVCAGIMKFMAPAHSSPSKSLSSTQAERYRNQETYSTGLEEAAETIKMMVESSFDDKEKLFVLRKVTFPNSKFKPVLYYHYATEPKCFRLVTAASRRREPNQTSPRRDARRAARANPWCGIVSCRPRGSAGTHS